MKKTIAGIAAGATMLFGGTAVADNVINPYTAESVQLTDGTVLQDALTIEASSTLPEAKNNDIIIDTTKPSLILSKWDGEVQMGITYTDMPANTTGSRPLLSKNVEWIDGQQKMEAVPLDPTPGMEDGGMEINIILNSLPATNVFNFAIDDAENLDFFYQAPLWVENGLKTPSKECADTDCTLNGETSHRPQNVVGSLAVFYKNHANHIEGQTNYATGKAYHIYRPLVTDVNGAITWGDLSYQNNVLSVTVPQTFLDSAVYPVKIDPTFGYTIQGGSQFNISTNNSTNEIAEVNQQYTANIGDTITSFSIYTNASTTDRTIGFGMYSFSGGIPVSLLSATTTLTLNNVADWDTTPTVLQSLVGGVVYVPSFGSGAQLGSQYYVAFDSGIAPGRFTCTTLLAPENYVNSIFCNGAGNIGTDSGRHYSLYATYTGAPVHAILSIPTGRTTFTKGKTTLP